jgi:DNA-binding NtrC family response regulator
LPILVQKTSLNGDDSEKELIYKMLFELKNDISDLKNLVRGILQTNSDNITLNESNSNLLERIFEDVEVDNQTENKRTSIQITSQNHLLPKADEIEEFNLEEEESLKLADREKELIIKALGKHHNKRKYAALDLGISERTLYRKIKEYNI